MMSSNILNNGVIFGVISNILTHHRESKNACFCGYITNQVDKNAR